MNKQSLNIPAIAVMYLLFFMIAFVTNFAGSMGVVLKNHYDVSNALTQLGSLANFLAYACLGVPAGIILRRRGYKFTAITAVLVGLLGVGIQWLSGSVGGFAVYVLGAFIAGISMCLLNSVVNPMLNTLGGGGNLGNRLLQFGGACNSIGGTLAPVLLGYFIGADLDDADVGDAAYPMMAAMVIFVIAFFVLFFSRIPEPHIETPEQREVRLANRNTNSPWRYRHFVLGAIAIFFYVGLEVGIPNMANLYMSDTDWVGPKAAGMLVGLYWISMMVGRLLGGLVGGKVSSRTMLVCTSVLCIALLLAIILLPESANVTFHGRQRPISMFLMVICGLCTSVMWGSIFNLSVEGLGDATPAASGIFMMFVCGGGIIPFLQGITSDLFGGEGKAYLYSYVLLVVCLVYILYFAFVGSKHKNN